MLIKDYGYQPVKECENNGFIPARVLAVHKERYELICDHGFCFGRLKSGVYHKNPKEPYPTVGDFVLIQYYPDGDSRITKTLPRTSYFFRKDPGSFNKEQAVAANFDIVFLLQSMNQNFNPKRLERYLSIIKTSNAQPVILLTKSDLVTDEDREAYLKNAESVAKNVSVHAISIKTGMGLEFLQPYLKKGTTILLLGSSGVGKSSLINRLADEPVMTVNEIREKDGRGRHTTTCRRLIRLKSGVMLMDTPGMRELGLLDVEEGVAESFSDVEQYLGCCKFSDCKHQTEPGCAIKKAIQDGNLSLSRWESYCLLQKEAVHLKKPRRFQEETTDYRYTSCTESFVCKVCGSVVTPEGAGTSHRNHCPNCLSSLHVDNRPGDRASLCKGVMVPIGVWVRKNGEWAIIHRCQTCGMLIANRIAADDNPALLMSIAVRPLAEPPFPLSHLDKWQ